MKPPLKPLIHLHVQYISDPSTMGPYERAIASAVRPGDRVLDVGAGTGVLGYLACQAGAAHIAAIEPSEMLELAREIAAANGLADRITHIRQLSFDVDQPERADVALVSMLARFGLEDGILPTAIDLKRRLLKPGATFVPGGVELFIAPVEVPDWYTEHVDGWQRHPSGFSCGALRAAALDATGVGVVAPDALLSDAASVAQVRFADVESADLRCQARQEVRRAGVMHAVAGWSAWTFAEGIVNGNAPGSRNTWGQVVFPLDEAVPVDRGDRVEFDLTIEQQTDTEQQWAWTVRVSSAATGHTRVSSHRTRGRAADLATGGAQAPDESLQADALALFDGRRTVRAIADELIRRHPERFRPRGDALRFVAGLSKRWST